MFLYSGEAEIPCDRAEMREAGGGPGRGLLCEYFKKESLRLKHDFNFFCESNADSGQQRHERNGEMFANVWELTRKKGGNTYVR